MLSDTKDVYRMDHRALWNVSSPRDTIRTYLHRIMEFVGGLAIRELTCRPTRVNAMWFGFGGIEAVHTALAGSPLYAVSVGVSYGPRSLVLATLRCLSGRKADSEKSPAEQYEIVEAEATESVTTWLDFRFMDSLMANLHEVAADKL
jgi:hypothetical protein